MMHMVWEVSMQMWKGEVEVVRGVVWIRKSCGWVCGKTGSRFVVW